ncbi:MAG: hypothetical protein OSB67_06125 [Alphaproteobacteria bacterium]|jgi:hypothetical protein|nr:hypothetical protein [Alphaproteobacteria bacterium]
MNNQSLASLVRFVVDIVLELLHSFNGLIRATAPTTMIGSQTSKHTHIEGSSANWNPAASGRMIAL